MMAPSIRVAGQTPSYGGGRHLFPEQLVKLSPDNSPEMLRMIQQYLNQHGYEDIAEQLALRSNVPLEEAHVSNFRK